MGGRGVVEGFELLADGLAFDDSLNTAFMAGVLI